jgi:hypothetical protein
MPDYIIGPQLVSISDSGNYTTSIDGVGLGLVR